MCLKCLKLYIKEWSYRCSPLQELLNWSCPKPHGGPKPVGGMLGSPCPRTAVVLGPAAVVLALVAVGLGLQRGGRGFTGNPASLHISTLFFDTVVHFPSVVCTRLLPQSAF